MARNARRTAARAVGRGALPAAFAVLLAAENAFPLRHRTRSRKRRYLANAGIAIAMGVASAIEKRAVHAAGTRLNAWMSPVRGTVRVPGWLSVGLKFLAMDCAYYLWHRLNHVNGYFWRFHAVHHMDPDLDVTTALRFHFGEILHSTAFRTVQLTVAGPSPRLRTTFDTVFELCVLFHHSNLRLPPRIDRALNAVTVTPRMHGIHHSVVRDERNANYSAVFAWWDMLFGSLRLDIPQERLTIGVVPLPTYDTESVPTMLAKPFRRGLR
ncbi:MAG: sterol desaturase family protein [Chitinivibrionales bacterium]|nr:sterol desaturase family protein [Chitinivibrionales bacterium]